MITKKLSVVALCLACGVLLPPHESAWSNLSASVLTSLDGPAKDSMQAPKPPRVVSDDSTSGWMSEDDSELGVGGFCFCGTDFATGLPFCSLDQSCALVTPCGGGQGCPPGSACLANNCCPAPQDFGCVPICPNGPACNNPGVCGTFEACQTGECPKDEVVTIPFCDAPPIKVFGNTQGAGNDSLCRPSEDLIITFVILEPGEYTFDLTANVDDPCTPVSWDSYMYLVGGDACACNAADIIAFDDDCSCIGLSCIGPVNLQPGEYWIVVEGFGVADAVPVDLHITSECKHE